jgi:hypothetical protein
MEGKYSELSEKYENLQKQFNLKSTKRKQTFRCDRCKLSFGSLSAYQKHKQTHMENNERFQCNHCEREFDEEWKLKCYKIFNYSDTLGKHVKIIHEHFKLLF